MLSKPCGFKTFVTLAKPPFPKSGTFTYSIAPTLGTQFLVLIADRHVVELTVRVQPRITLTRTGNQYKVEVTTGNGAGLGGRTAVLEQKSASGGWKRVGTTKLKLTSQPDQIDAVAGGLARATLKGSGPVRARISAAQAAPCFAPVASPPLR